MNTRYICGVLVVLAAVSATTWNALGQPYPQAVASSAGSGTGGLITHVHKAEGKPITVIVVEPQRRVMAVYHVMDTGEIKPKSVRSLQWDLKMQEFNSPDLPPAHVKTRLERSN